MTQREHTTARTVDANEALRRHLDACNEAGRGLRRDAVHIRDGDVAGAFAYDAGVREALAGRDYAGKELEIVATSREALPYTALGSYFDNPRHLGSLRRCGGCRIFIRDAPSSAAAKFCPACGSGDLLREFDVSDVVPSVSFCARCDLDFATPEALPGGAPGSRLCPRCGAALPA